MPNWSFEDTIDCTSFNINNAQHWCPVGKSPTIHLYKCQSDSWGTTPHQYNSICAQSYQIPKTGNAYAAFTIYNQSSLNNFNAFPQVKLIDTLKLNKIYCVSFYVSLWNYCKFSFDKLGAILTRRLMVCAVSLVV